MVREEGDGVYRHDDGGPWIVDGGRGTGAMAVLGVVR
jgi:hypothetical protein